MTSTHTLAVAALALAEAEQDFALWQRLTSAERRVKQLTQEHEKASANHDREEAAKAKATAAARFKGLSDLQVTRVATKLGESVLRSAWHISYNVAAHDWHGRPEPKRRTVNGFKALEPLPFAFLIERHPEQIPAEIMALAPGDPLAAFDAYFVALGRGYTISPKVAA
jgi:hypothetical protein